MPDLVSVTEKLTAKHTILDGLSLFAMTILSRIPFRSEVLYHWDSVNLAFGMREFDISIEQPQPPGYIVYIWLCRLVDALFNNPQTTMVWIAVLSSGLAVGATYLLGTAMFGRQAGLIGGLFLASSPLFWFYGEIALPHALDASLVTLSAFGLYQVMRGRTRLLCPTIGILALVGGVRQQSLIFLLPLVLFALRGVHWTQLVAAALLGSGLCLVWAIPLFRSCGGFPQYLKIFSEYSAYYTSTTSILSGAGWSGVGYNLSRIGRYLLYACSAALLPLAAHLLQRSGLSLWRTRRERSAFLGLWCLPTAMLYTFVHMGQQGTLFTFLPALMIGIGAATVHLVESWSARSLALVSGVLAAINVALFVALPQYPFGSDSFKVLSWSTLRERDAHYQGKFDTIRNGYSPERTIILASDWRHPQWYLSDYSLLQFDIGEGHDGSRCYVTSMGREARFQTLSDLRLATRPRT